MELSPDTQFDRESFDFVTAIAAELPQERRSWAVRRVPAYRAMGFEALIDARTPREPKVSKGCRQVIQTARETNPKVTMSEVTRILAGQGIKPLPSASTIKREFSRVDGRRKYAREKVEREEIKVENLPFAGGELLAAAEIETGGIAALSDEVVQMAEGALAASVGQTPVQDVAHRDAKGHFTITYNRRRKRKKGERIASYLRSAEEKAQGRVPSWPRFAHEKRETLDPKIRMLVFGWMVAGTKGWDSLRAPDVAGLASLTGFAYMPSTLSKLVSALAISNAGPALLNVVGRHWHGVAQARWNEGGAMAALYIDNHAKEVWTSLLTRSGKVSHLNRVMPSITSTYAHTGAGTPLVLSVQSGSAPLAPRLVQLVEQAESILETDVARAVVIDAEGSTFDILESFTKAGRVVITPLKPSRLAEFEISYSRGSYYRPYREHDELRIAEAILHHKTSGRSLEIGALLVRRAHREGDTVLVTNGIALGMEGRDLADLYFRRWPVQENFFKDAGVLRLNDHRGNCGRMVANVAVVTELDRLESRATRGTEVLREIEKESAALSWHAQETKRDNDRAQAALATRRGRLDQLVTQDKTGGKAFTRAALDHQQALVAAETCASGASKARARMEKSEAHRIKLEGESAEIASRRAKLEPQRTIRSLDVAQDAILTAMKLTAAQLIAFVLREYLPSFPMTAETFLRRVFTIAGRREIRPTEELVVMYENPRDPAVNEALTAATSRLNARGISRDNVDDPVAGLDRLLIVLDDKHGVAEIAQSHQRVDEALVVSLM